MFLQLLASELQKIPDRKSEVTEDEVVIYGVLNTLNKPGYKGDVSKDLAMIGAIRYKQYQEERKPTTINLKEVEMGLLKAPHFQINVQEENDFV